MSITLRIENFPESLGVFARNCEASMGAPMPTKAEEIVPYDCPIITGARSSWCRSEMIKIVPIPTRDFEAITAE